MPADVTRKETLRIVRGVLAADCACPEAASDSESVVVTKFEERAGRRRFPVAAKPLLIVTMGAGVVAACHPSRIGWLRELLGDASRDAVFAPPVVAALVTTAAGDGQELRGPALKLVCAPEAFRPPAEPPGVTLSVVEGSAVAELYRHAGFGNALAYRATVERPDVAAVVARRGETIAGVAGASADCDALWQIGVDVVPAARGVGVGRALVGRLTELAFATGRVPYYSVAASNVHSLALATGLGYWPAWTEVHAKDAVGR